MNTLTLSNFTIAVIGGIIFFIIAFKIWYEEKEK